tara:strand:+ start:972 stop:1238 length:267 start_codon:yes stop_codon:yes gene_type:complete
MNRLRLFNKEPMMPHVIVKLWPGKTEEQKKELTQKIVDAVHTSLGNGLHSISVGFEEISSENWKEEVYDKDIKNGPGTIYQEPGYTMD